MINRTFLYANVFVATEAVPLGNSVYIYTYLILDPMFYHRRKLAYNNREDKAVSDLNQSFMQVPEKNPNIKSSEVQVTV